MAQSDSACADTTEKTMAIFTAEEANKKALELVSEAIKSGSLSFENFTKYADAHRGGTAAATFVNELVRGLAVEIAKM
jgi:hypothetical protein